LLNSRGVVMPGLVPGIHGPPPQRQCSLKSGLFPQPASERRMASLGLILIKNS
jgi:hypothetical protein